MVGMVANNRFVLRLRTKSYDLYIEKWLTVLLACAVTIVKQMKDCRFMGKFYFVLSAAL